MEPPPNSRVTSSSNYLRHSPSHLDTCPPGYQISVFHTLLSPTQTNILTRDSAIGSLKNRMKGGLSIAI